MSYLCYLCLFSYSGVQHILFLLCFSSSCVLYVAGFSRLSIFDCPFGILERLLTVTQRVLNVEQELLILQEHPSTPRFVVGFVLLGLQCVLWIIVCPVIVFACHSSIYRFRSPFWCLQTFLIVNI